MDGDNMATARLLSRLGHPECSLCERPALYRTREWRNFGTEFLVCGICELEYKRDPSGEPRNFEWVEAPRGRK